MLIHLHRESLAWRSVHASLLGLLPCAIFTCLTPVFGKASSMQKVGLWVIQFLKICFYRGYHVFGKNAYFLNLRGPQRSSYCLAVGNMHFSATILSLSLLTHGKHELMWHHFLKNPVLPNVLVSSYWIIKFGSHGRNLLSIHCLDNSLFNTSVN